MSKTFVADLRAGEPVTSSFLAQKIQIRQKRTGEEYLSLQSSAPLPTATS